jgi:hypothetical protein
VVEDKARVCPIVFGIGRNDLKGPLKGFQAIEFNRTEVHQLLITINKAAPKEVALAEGSLNTAFNMWWPELEKKVAAISSAIQPPSGPVRSERDLLEEAVSNTRTLLREFQGPEPPWRGIAFSPQIVEALLRGSSEKRADAKDKVEFKGGLGDLTVAKSE